MPKALTTYYLPLSLHGCIGDLRKPFSVLSTSQQELWTSAKAQEMPCMCPPLLWKSQTWCFSVTSSRHVQWTEADMEKGNVKKKSHSLPPCFQGLLCPWCPLTPQPKRGMAKWAQWYCIPSLNTHIPDPHLHTLPFSWQDQTCNKDTGVKSALLASGKQAAGRIASSTWKKHRKKGNSVIETPENSSAPGFC